MGKRFLTEGKLRYESEENGRCWLLGGFAGIGFMAYRRKSKAASMAA